MTLNNGRAGEKWRWWLAAGCLLVVGLSLLMIRRSAAPNSPVESQREAQATGSPGTHSRTERNGRAFRPGKPAGPEDGKSAEEIVAGKLSQFTAGRRALLDEIAKRNQKPIPPEVERFFAAAKSGNFEEAKAAFEALQKLREEPGRAEQIAEYRGAILETLGAMESVHDWPAQKLLDYGNSILSSLKPGMVYVGGTDPGRFIPTMLNDTTEGERHIVVTQNALADGSYLDYLRFLYGDKMATLTADESQSAFQEYLTDAQKRLTHDQQFPNEPGQLRPGEDIKMTDGKVQVSGQVAVMLINELLLQKLMDKNPDMSFGLEESFPLKSTYTNASPMGPLMELRVRDEQNSLNADTASQAVEYWRSASQNVLAGIDPASEQGLTVVKAYSKMAASQANLFADRNLNSEAEELYRVGMQIYPENPEATYGLANLLVREGREAEARRIVDDFKRRNPDVAKDAPAWKAIFSAKKD